MSCWSSRGYRLAAITQLVSNPALPEHSRDAVPTLRKLWVGRTVELSGGRKLVSVLAPRFSSIARESEDLVAVQHRIVDLDRRGLGEAGQTLDQHLWW